MNEQFGNSIHDAVTPAAPSIVKMQASGSGSGSSSEMRFSALFFFLGAITVLGILLILMIIYWKFDKAKELMKSMLRNKRLEGKKI